MENVTATILPSNTTTEETEDLPSITFNSVHTFSLIVYIVAFLLGTTGNGLVIWVAGFRMKKTVNVVWFLNLAIADFIFTLFLPLSITYLVLVFHWPFGTFMCKLNSAVAFLNMFASIFTLTVISIDRCISVVFPVWAQNHRTPRMAFIVAIIVWILAIFFSLTYFIFRDAAGDEGQIRCFNNFHDTDYDLHLLRLKATVITRFIFGFFIPFTIIFSCYTIIVIRLHRNRMASSTKPFKIIIAVLLSFFICWFPYHVFSFLEVAYNESEDDSLRSAVEIGGPITSSLAFFNSCINPFLYVFIGRDFKTTFRTSIQSIFEKAFSEDNGQTEIKTKSTSDSQLV
ncbi:chemokine-like receptor 1 [Pelobates cultripes]|uniref:Chemokine-like receptor 1 n=1 Tax=Pelobates cultripes TaxID=61616 RepID=A0AAD1RSK9_PELCU|nr:chemokine-like receptor 1 [Pelobates cultripes]CAH2277355.1 chemokine-like receptor 1 [Pelobates cultripes]